MVTVVPTPVVEGGADEEVIAVQGKAVSVYWNALKASYVLGAVPNVPRLAASRTQTENRYEPAGLPAVLHMKVELME